VGEAIDFAARHDRIAEVQMDAETLVLADIELETVHHDWALVHHDLYSPSTPANP
jgi:hypothetical protein